MRYPRIGSWVNSETGEVLLHDLHCAHTFVQRFLGLQFQHPMPQKTGLLIHGTSAIHTFCMRFPIDVAFLDQDMRVVEMRCSIAPWRIAIPKDKRTRHVIEANAGTFRDLPNLIATEVESRGDN